MADHLPLTIQAGKTTRLATTDAVNVGTGVVSDGASNLNLRAGGSSIDIQLGKNLTALGGATAVDFSAGGGVFKTTTGVVTIGPGAVGVSGIATFSAAGTALVVSNNASIGGTLDVATIDRSGTISIGATNGTSITIGRTGQTTTVAGNLSVSGTEVVVGATTFQSSATFEGNVTFGNATTDTVAFVSRVGPSGNLDVNFVKELNHALAVDASTTVSTAGGNLTVQSGAGSAASGATAAAAGGSCFLRGGIGGAASTTAGGAAGIGAPANLIGGTGGAGAGAPGNNAGAVGGSGFVGGGTGGAGGATFAAGQGGDVVITAGTAGAAAGGAGANGGNVSVDAGTPTGSGTDGTITIGGTTASAIAIGKSGITTTVTGGLSQLTGAVSLAANAASSFTTSSGALTFTSATSATWSVTTGALSLNASLTVQLQSGGSTKLTIGSTGAVVQAGATLSTTSTGNINLPQNASARFQIEGVSTGATVTAANLNTLTDGSNADALHVHAGAAATTVTFTATSGEAISAGEVVAMDDSAGSARLFKADANGAGELVEVLGVANNTVVGAGSSVTVIMIGERIIPDAEWDAVPLTADVGRRVYMSLTAGNLTLTAPSATGQTSTCVGRITFAGGAVNTTKVAVNIGEQVVIP